MGFLECCSLPIPHCFGLISKKSWLRKTQSQAFSIPQEMAKRATIYSILVARGPSPASMILFFPHAEASLALLQAHTLALIFLQGGLLIPESDLLGGLLPIWSWG